MARKKRWSWGLTYKVVDDEDFTRKAGHVFWRAAWQTQRQKDFFVSVH